MTTRNLVESLVNSSWASYLFGFIGWYVMWQLQLHLTTFDYAMGVSLIFLPAGIRTLSVLIFGFRGAVGVFVGAIVSTIEYMGHVKTMDLFNICLVAGVSAFSAYLMMVFVCWWRRVGANLDELTFRDVLVIVFSQGLMSATLHQIIFALHTIEAVYDHPSHADALRLWAAMAVGDVVGSMVLMTGAVALVNLFQRLRQESF